ncbi:MAG TPA: PEP-CTERM sorting domain-containing protein [Fimbriiglobus sp.]|nr:PEP-CTERM sorting domain-containing protein [Fimbriiglobus sp.]
MANNDWTGAYQWDLVIAPGGSATIQFEMGVSPVPEPGSVLALAAVGLGLVCGRRDRLTPRG